MPIDEVEPLSGEQFVKILNALPEPSYVTLSMAPDVGALAEKISKQFPGINFNQTSFKEIEFLLKKLSKAKIIELYTSDLEREFRISSVEWRDKDWPPDVRAGITLTPFGISAFYEGKQPEYITNLIKTAEEAGLNLSLNIEPKSF